VIQAIKSKKIRGRSALRPLDIAGLSQFLVQVSNLIVPMPTGNIAPQKWPSHCLI